jgi:hypothetical protein
VIWQHSTPRKRRINAILWAVRRHDDKREMPIGSALAESSEPESTVLCGAL